MSNSTCFPSVLCYLWKELDLTLERKNNNNETGFVSSVEGRKERGSRGGAQEGEGRWSSKICSTKKEKKKGVSFLEQFRRKEGRMELALGECRKITMGQFS